MFLASTKAPRPRLLPWAHAKSKKRDSQCREPTTATLHILQLHHCCASRKNKTLPPGRKSTARTGRKKQQQKSCWTRKDLIFKNIKTVLPSSEGAFTPKYTRCPNRLLHLSVCLCVCVWEAGKFPAGPFAISYTFSPQSRFIVCLLEGQRTRMQPKYIEALFMLAADGWSLGRDPEDPGSVRSHCLVKSDTCQNTAKLPSREIMSRTHNRCFQCIVCTLKWRVLCCKHIVVQIFVVNKTKIHLRDFEVKGLLVMFVWLRAGAGVASAVHGQLWNLCFNMLLTQPLWLPRAGRGPDCKVSLPSKSTGRPGEQAHANKRRKYSKTQARKWAG